MNGKGTEPNVIGVALGSGKLVTADQLYKPVTDETSFQYKYQYLRDRLLQVRKSAEGIRDIRYDGVVQGFIDIMRNLISEEGNVQLELVRKRIGEIMNGVDAHNTRVDEYRKLNGTYFGFKVPSLQQSEMDNILISLSRLQPEYGDNLDLVIQRHSTGLPLYVGKLNLMDVMMINDRKEEQ